MGVLGRAMRLLIGLFLIFLTYTYFYRGGFTETQLNAVFLGAFILGLGFIFYAFFGPISVKTHPGFSRVKNLYIIAVFLIIAFGALYVLMLSLEKQDSTGITLSVLIALVSFGIAYLGIKDRVRRKGKEKAPEKKNGK